MFGQSGNFYQGMDFDPSEFGFGGFGGRGHTYTYTTGNGDFSDFFNMFLAEEPVPVQPSVLMIYLETAQEQGITPEVIHSSPARISNQKRRWILKSI